MINNFLLPTFLLPNFLLPTIYPTIFEGISCLYLHHPCGGRHCDEARRIFARNVSVKQKNVIRTKRYQNNTRCNNSQLYITTCYIDTGCTYCHVTALRYNSTMSTCSQADGYLSTSKAFLQNTAAHKKKKFSAFY